MRILQELTAEEIGDNICEVVDCGNLADLYVTDDTEGGEGYICKKCNWQDDYVARLVERGVDAELAKQTLEAAMDDLDYEDDPKDAADEELSCWSE